jgi:site-specific recombinase XerD
MNQRAPGFLLSKCIEGFLRFKAAEALSHRTIVSYEQHLRVWSQQAGEIQVGRITTPDLRSFLAWLRME